MSDSIEVLVGLVVCAVPSALLLWGLVALVRALSGRGNHERITHLEATVGELSGQNRTLLHQMSQLERRVVELERTRAEVQTVTADADRAMEVGAGGRTTVPGPIPALVDGVGVDDTPGHPVAARGSEKIGDEAALSAALSAVPERSFDAVESDGERAAITDARGAGPDAHASGSPPRPAAPDAFPEALPLDANAVPQPRRPGPALNSDAVGAQTASASASGGTAATDVTTSATSSTPSQPQPRIAWEQWIGVRGAAALGASILVLAGIYFFEYSIEHGLITPAMRMVAGTLVGLACLAGSELRLRKSYTVLASWLSGAGIAILYVAFWAGHSLYELYPAWAAGLLLVATTGACVGLANARRSMPIAILGLFGGFVTPLALSTGADRPIPLFGYLLLLDAAILWVSYRRKWSFLAAACLAGTAVYQQGWLLGRLDEPRLVLGVVVAGAFAILFGALPKLSGEDPDADESMLWKLTRSAGVFVPLVFTVWLAARTDIGETFWVSAVQLILLCIAACAVAMRHRSVLLPTGAALAAALTVLGRAVGHPPETLERVWQLAGLAAVLMLVFSGLAELARFLDRRAGDGPSTSEPGPRTRAIVVAASVFGLAVLGLVALAAPFAEAAGPWPWLLVWALAPMTLGRLGTLGGWPQLQIPGAALVAVGLGATFAHVAGGAAQPPTGVYLACIALAALGLQAAGLLPFRSEGARKYADHAAVLFAVLAMPLIALVHETVTLPTWAFYACTGALALLGLFGAARRGSSVWLAVVAVVTAGTHGLWVMRRIDGPFALTELGTLLACVLVFAFFPAIAPRRMREQPWAWRTAAFVGPLYFLPMRLVYLDAVGAGSIGLLAVVLALVSVAAAFAVRVRGPEATEARRTALAWLSATAAGFVTMAIPLQLEQEWITIGWALEAMALTVLWRRLDHPGLKYLAFGLGAAVGVRLLANPYVLGYYERSDLRIFNWLSYTYLVPALCFVGAWWALRKLEASRLRKWELAVLPRPMAPLAGLAAAAALMVVFAWLNLTIFDWFAPGAELSIPTDRLPARDLSLSIAWAIYAVGMLALGMWRRSTALRVVSLLLVLVTSAKVFLYDLAHLQDLYRVASLAGLAISLIVISLAYQRFVFRGARTEEVAQ